MDALACSPFSFRKAGAFLLGVVLAGVIPRIGFSSETPASQSESRQRTIGLVIVALRMHVGNDPGDCPQGLAMSPQDHYLQTLSQVEQNRLLKPENQSELNLKSTILPDGTDICLHPEVAVQRGPFRLMQGKVAAGLNLDGRISEGDFESPEGERGVDNQFYRVLGCVAPVRNRQFSEGMTNALMAGETTILLEIVLHDVSGNEMDAEITIYSGIDPIVRDRNGKAIPYASYRITDNSKWINRTHAKVSNGVLTTESIDMKLRYQLNSLLTEFELLQGRFRLQLQPDGTAKGVLAGYEKIDNWFDLMRTYGANLGFSLKFDCPSIYQQMWKHADGGWNQKEGRFTAISNGYEFEAIPAFLVKPSRQQ